MCAVVVLLVGCNLSFGGGNPPPVPAQIPPSTQVTEPAYSVKIMYRLEADMNANPEDGWQAGLVISAWGINQSMTLLDPNGTEVTVYPSPQETFLENWNPERLRISQIRNPSSGFWSVTAERENIMYYGGGG